LFEQRAIALWAAIQKPPELEIVQIQSVGGIHIFDRDRHWGAKPRAEQIARDGVHPKTDQARIAKLIAIFPPARPCGLSDFLRVFERSSRDSKNRRVALYPDSNASA